MVIRIEKFAGEIPKLGAKLLPQNNAQVCTNGKLYSGELKPFKAPSGGLIVLAGTEKTIFWWNNTYWLTWTVDVNVIRGPVQNDTTEKIYWTGQGAPKVSDSVFITESGAVAKYRVLGIPKPTDAPTLSLEGDTTLDGDHDEDRAYVYTWVSDWGEEGPPSDPATIIVNSESCNLQTQAVKIEGFTARPHNDNTAGYRITELRLYRTNTGVNGTEFQYVGSLDLTSDDGSGMHYDDMKPDDQLEEVLPSTNWYAPPSGLQGLTAMANGILAGFVGKDIYFCEAYLPHAWPLDYRLSVDDTIIALGAYETNLVITTKSHTYIATGVDPSSMSLTKLPINQSCVSKRGLANVGKYGVVYPSPDGLISISGSIRNLTDDIMGRDEWQAINPTDIIGFGHDDKYFAFWQSASGGFIVNPGGNDLTAITTSAAAGYVDLKDDSLYFRSGTSIYRWEGGITPLSFTWKSKKFETPTLVNFGCGQVYYDKSIGDLLTLKVYADGVLKHTQYIESADSEDNPSGTSPFRLPSGYLAREWEFQLEGNVNVKSMTIAEVMAEIGGH